MKLTPLHVKENTTIQYMSHELLFLAQSGQPYRGTIYINFTSTGETFDLRDFKKYLTSLRDKKYNAEDIVYEIYETITKSIQTENLGVIVDLTARGGIQQRLCYGAEFDALQKENIFQVR
ncbi:hypothetical protein [Sulfurimonas autotrophica]|uniref:Uncharacterized protein n=1 Tax=Sulfurimonas autotrophica (strain ATCC BAA-671 / DSM 16294 / JCM 11897 / OK10) TaxID=563040 RepID=E0UU68_SULAO|nr:hypothetical protein [Sulfurimonas autotrophica]ADN09443.1 hypothetical protein Saut_1396 [Sulfurimonas autotrophica DSM 16294]